jgi:hypothetical protein
MIEGLSTRSRHRLSTILAARSESSGRKDMTWMNIQEELVGTHIAAIPELYWLCFAMCIVAGSSIL